MYGKNNMQRLSSGGFQAPQGKQPGMGRVASSSQQPPMWGGGQQTPPQMPGRMGAQAPNAQQLSQLSQMSQPAPGAVPHQGGQMGQEQNRMRSMASALRGRSRGGNPRWAFRGGR
jgi:hypothetical protein